MVPIRKGRRVGKEEDKRPRIIKNMLLIILGLVLGILFGYKFPRKSPEPWKPILETSSFDYLDDVVDNALTKMRESAGPDVNDRTVESKPAIHHVEQSLFKLKYYYLPITEVRQLIFDADRLFYLGQQDEAYQKLAGAKEVVESIARSDVLSAQKPLLELGSLLDELMISMSKNSPEIPEQFHEVGHRVNMMAYKGELIISGVKVPDDN
jgi:hypothetical protein